jgi:DNA-binding CsgD family transcriptional regulator
MMTKKNVTEHKRIEEIILKLNNCFLKLGPESAKNIKIIVSSAGSILDGVCALYNRLENGLLCTRGKWKAPEDMPLKDKAKGHICYDVISANKNEPFIMRDLGNSSYVKSDSNVKKYNLRTYIGCLVRIKGKPVGSLCIVYQKDKKFKSNEIKAILILAKALGIEEERGQAEVRLKKFAKELQEQKLALEQKNITLIELVSQIELEKDKIKKDIATNIDQLIFPVLDRLKIKKNNQKYITLLQHHLKELTSSFGRKITKKSLTLTAKEIEICSMIKGSITSKEISDILSISLQTVEKHRKNIRRKLGISNKDINLFSFLQSL